MLSPTSHDIIITAVAEKERVLLLGEIVLWKVENLFIYLIYLLIIPHKENTVSQNNTI